MKSMKQFIAGFIILASSIVPFSVFAAGSAEMGFSQTNVSVENGEKFDLTVTFDAKSESIDTVRSVVTFDPTILKAESTSLVGPFNRNAPGNYIDNKTGKVFWGGFTLEALKENSGSFAKITFSAKQAGQATVAINKESKITNPHSYSDKQRRREDQHKKTWVSKGDCGRGKISRPKSFSNNHKQFNSSRRIRMVSK